MVEHRKNVPTRKAYVPSGWFIVLTIMICVGGAGWLAALVVGDSGDDPAPSAASTSATPKPSATPSASASPSASPEPEPTKKSAKPTPSPSASAAPVARDASVSVLNNTGIVGAAKAFSVKVQTAGWTLGGIGNWTGSIDGNTIYYPAALQAQAELLGRDVGIDRIRPSIAPMRMDRLTVILSDPR